MLSKACSKRGLGTGRQAPLPRAGGQPVQDKSHGPVGARGPQPHQPHHLAAEHARERRRRARPRLRRPGPRRRRVRLPASCRPALQIHVACSTSRCARPRLRRLGPRRRRVRLPHAGLPCMYTHRVLACSPSCTCMFPIMTCMFPIMRQHMAVKGKRDSLAGASYSGCESA